MPGDNFQLLRAGKTMCRGEACGQAAYCVAVTRRRHQPPHLLHPVLRRLGLVRQQLIVHDLIAQALKNLEELLQEEGLSLSDRGRLAPEPGPIGMRILLACFAAAASVFACLAGGASVAAIVLGSNN